jgi:lysophospholipase L1-like esterase
MMNEIQPKRKIITFKVISVLLPFVILLLFESGLRMFNYGTNFDLFIQSAENKEFLIFNPNASKRYFSDQQIAPTGNAELFRKKKNENTVRIFVLGESTTIGYPYFHNGSFHRWLQYRLSHTFPNKNFEIINLSLTAVNSYTVLGFARELVDYEPDAVLIYAGHNEYYGALGVGSTENVGSKPALVNLILKARELKLVQLTTNVLKKFVNLLAPQTKSRSASRMELMAADQKIPFGSNRYNDGIRQFRQNMSQALQILSSRDIPVFLSNVVANEADLKPFVSFEVEKVKYPGFKTKYNAALKAFKQKNIAEANICFKAANKIYGSHSMCNYYLGKIALSQNRISEARHYLSRAKDLDGLRFRAPEQINTIILQLCKKYPGVHLVNTKSAFELHSKKLIIGSELILEHVHPNLKGYALMSDVFYQSIKEELAMPFKSEDELSFNRLLSEMPITKIDSLCGVYRIANLKRNWPFNEAMSQDSLKIASFEEQLAYDLTNKKIDWWAAMNKLYTYYIDNNQLHMACLVMESLVLEFPTDVKFYEEAAMLSGKLNDRVKVVYYLRKAFLMEPSFNTARYLFVVYLQLDRPSEALPYLDYAINNSTSDLPLRSVKRSAEQLARLKTELESDPKNVFRLIQIAEIYYKIDNMEAASKYVNLILKVDKHNRTAFALRDHIHTKLNG